MNEVVVYQLI